MTNRLVHTLTLATVMLTAGAARAQTPMCEDDVAVGPNRVYIQAADTQVPVLKALGKKLRTQATPLTIIYSPNGSCSNINYVYTDDVSVGWIRVAGLFRHDGRAAGGRSRLRRARRRQ